MLVFLFFGRIPSLGRGRSLPGSLPVGPKGLASCLSPLPGSLRGRPAGVSWSER